MLGNELVHFDQTILHRLNQKLGILRRCQLIGTRTVQTEISSLNMRIMGQVSSPTLKPSFSSIHQLLELFIPKRLILITQMGIFSSILRVIDLINS